MMKRYYNRFPLFPICYPESRSTERDAGMTGRGRKILVNSETQLSPIERVQLARHPKRPNAMDFLNYLFTDFTELHGDGLFGDDGAIVAGIARIEGIPCAVIAEVKGKTLEENNIRNFGSPHPEGYRKARRVCELAERFSLPVLTFIDTSGAYPGIGAEERGQARAIAENLLVFSKLKTRIIVTIIGEGGSGGALAIGVGDLILMMENAIYSVISPEGCSAILFKSPEHTGTAAKNLKITSSDLLALGAIDEIIPEGPGAEKNPSEAYQNLKKTLVSSLNKMKKIPLNNLVAKRYDKFRKMFSPQEKI